MTENVENITEELAPDQPMDATVEDVVKDKNHPQDLKKRLLLYNLRQLALIFAAALATAVSLELFLLPSNVVIGGALGIASILDILLCHGNSQWYLSAAIWLLAVNVPIFVASFVVYRKRFVVKTLLYVLFLAGQMLALRLFNVSDLFQKLVAGNEYKDMVIYVVVGGALHGVSLPIMLSINASTGGSDIVGLLVQKRSKRSSSIAMRVILATNVAVVLISAIVFGIVKNDVESSVNMFIYSVAAMFICEIVQELIYQGFSSALEMEVTTDKPDEMIEAFHNELKHGTTCVKVKGGYTGQERTMVLCVINKQQLTHARRIINRVDDKAFAYVENVKEVVGKGFANKEIELDQD